MMYIRDRPGCGRHVIRGIESIGFCLLLLSQIPGAQAQTTSDIIVTGEKIARPLQTTASSVTLVPAPEIELRGLDTLQSIVGRTANVSSVYGPAGFSIRGIANIGVSGAGEAATATVYVDGIPLASTYLQGAPTRLWDVSQVEIWRGPQSTLRGLNSLAGAVIIQTVDPDTHDWDLHARTWLNDERARGFAIAGGGPLQRDQLAVRVVAETQSRNGFIHNLTRHTGEDREASNTVRVKILWKPQALPGFSLQLGYNRFRREGGFYRVFARTDTVGFPHHPVATDNIPNTTDLDFDGISSLGRYEIDDGLSVVNEANWSRANERSQFDGDYGPANASFGQQQRTYKTVTEELRLQIDKERLKGVAGLFYYDRDLASTTQSRTGVPTPVATIAGLLRAGGFNTAQSNAIASAYAATLPTISVDFSGAFPTRVRSYAAFSDLRYRLNDRLWLLAGFRYDHETTNTRVIQNTALAGPLPNPGAFGPFAPVIAQINIAVGSFATQASAALPSSDRSFSTFLPKLGLLVDWNDKLTTSAVVQRGYRSGGLSTNIARAQAFPYDPEYTWNYELSLRSLLLDGQLRLNANAFFTDWRRQQVSVNFGLNAFDVNTVNAGRSEVYGFEIEASHRLSEEWALYAAIGHSRTRFKKFDLPQSGVTTDLKGTEFAYAPHWTITGGTDFRLRNNIAGALSASYASRSYGAVGLNQSLYRVSPHMIVNGRLGYQTQRWSLFVEVRNLFDTLYKVYKSPTENRAILNEPRTLGAELSVRL